MVVVLVGPKRSGVRILKENSSKNVNVGAHCGIPSVKKDTQMSHVAYVQMCKNHTMTGPNNHVENRPFEHSWYCSKVL